MTGTSLVLTTLVVMVAQHSPPDTERIRPEDVNYRNYEAFVEEIRKDLPVGTPKSMVRDYLARRGLVFSDSRDEDLSFEPPRVEHYIVFTITGIRKAFIFGYIRALIQACG